jgi:adenine/guanine phosphoribosyltransferase-like PRPP-binding protein
MLVDDLIATGGTAEGAVKLLRQIGAEVLARLLHHRPAGARRRREAAPAQCAVCAR